MTKLTKREASLASLARSKRRSSCGMRSFRVELLPGGETRTVQYRGSRVEVRF